MYKLKEKDKAAFYFPTEEWVLPAASTKETEEKEFVVDSGASMHMVSKKDLNSAELETMRTSRSPTTVMTANGEVQTREEATVCVKQLDLFVKVMLLEETPAVLSLGKLCEDHGYTYHWISGQKPHLIRNGKRIDCNFSNYVPLVILGLSASSSSRILCLMSTDTLKIQYQKEVEVRVESSGETRCMKPQKPKTKINMWNQKEYKGIISRKYFGWLQEFRENLVDDSRSTEPWRNPEQGSQDTSKSSHEFPMEPRAKVEPGSGKHSVYTYFPKDPNCDICLKTKIPKASCRRRAGTVVPRAEIFGDWITAGHKVISEERESRNNHRYAVVVQDLATQWIQSYPCKSKSSQETQKNLLKFLEPMRKPNVIYTDNSLEVGKSCEELSWNHCTSTPHRSETNGIAERAVRRVKEGTSAVLLQSGLGNEWWREGGFYGMLLLSAKHSRSLV